MQLIARLLEFSQHRLETRNSEGPTLAARSDFNNFPLHPIQKRADPVIIFFSLLSGIATFSSFVFITWRLIFWRRYSSVYIGYNQYVILIYNLMIADMLTASAALITIHWHRLGVIQSLSNTCIAQGFLFQIGDPSIGMFVLAIALHTFVTVVLGRKLNYRVFVACIIGLWMFCLLQTVIPFMVGGKHVYEQTGAWCWISGKYQNTRLWTHYMWIFISQFGCVVLYTILFFYLRRKVALSASLTQPSREKLFRLKRVVTLMILYPLAYLFLSMPIAAGRMAVASGMKLSFVYVLSAACIMVTSGIVHAVIYTITRKSLILSSTPISNHISQHGASTRKEISGSHTDEESDVGTPVTSTFATGPPPPSSRSVGKYEKMCRRFNGSVSLGNGTRRLSSSGADEIVELNETGVYQQTTISVTHEPMPPIAQTRDGASSIGASINDTRPMSSRVFPKKQ